MKQREHRRHIHATFSLTSVDCRVHRYAVGSPASGLLVVMLLYNPAACVSAWWLGWQKSLYHQASLSPRSVNHVIKHPASPGGSRGLKVCTIHAVRRPGYVLLYDGACQQSVQDDEPTFGRGSQPYGTLPDTRCTISSSSSLAAGRHGTELRLAKALYSHRALS